MICKKCGKESIYVDADFMLCEDCVDNDFFEWIESKRPIDK